VLREFNDPAALCRTHRRRFHSIFITLVGCPIGEVAPGPES
jgi:hypothetical protein